MLKGNCCFLCYDLRMIKPYKLVEEEMKKDTYNTFIFNNRGKRALYLVGGYIRDLFRGIASHDRDFIVGGNILGFARRIQKRTGGSIVEFKPKNTVRLALKNGYTFDFSELKESIEENLSNRDFTINALAWSPVTGIIDLHGGFKHIKKKIISCISEKNMIADPLRMLRAYRFAAELDGSIDPNTREIIKKHARNIHSVSNERITLEMFHLLNTKLPDKYLTMALDDCILNQIISCNIDILYGNIKHIHLLNKRVLHLLPTKIKVTLHDSFAQNLKYQGLLCLHILMRGCCKTPIKASLTLSRKILDRIQRVNHGFSELQKMKKISKKKLFSLFHYLGDAAQDLLIVSMRLRYLKDFDKFQKIWVRGLLSSNEVMNISGITRGSDLGKMIMELRRAQFEARINSRKEALRFLQRYRI